MVLAVFMKANLKTAMSGFLISFLGTLPVGTLTITAFNVAATKSVNDAIWYAAAVVLVELIVVRLTLMGDKKINFDGKLSFYLMPIGAIVLFCIAIYTFMAIGKGEIGATTNFFPGIESVFLLGILLSALNPMHIPFWMGWNRVLISKGHLRNTWGSYTSYIVGIGIGSIGGLMIFIFAGNSIFDNYGQYTMIINLVLGLIYLGFSFYLMFLLYKKHLKLKIE